MTGILTRERMHELLDAVLDITDGGKGINGYPHVSMSVCNYGHPVVVYIMDNGFVADSIYDLNEAICMGGAESDEKLEKILEHLRGLKKERPHEPASSGTQKNNQLYFIRKEQKWKVLRLINLKSKM